MNLQQQIILQAIAKKIKNKADFDRLKQTVSSKFRRVQPATQAILKEYRKMRDLKKIPANPALEKILKTREVRTLSGVAVITVLTKPFPCPGACIYCPSDPRMPKSYLPKEPAAARALMLKFNPYQQVKKRIEALEMNGHPTDKIELIVKGGTWSAYPRKYQDWFIKRCFEGANENEKARKNQKNNFTLFFTNVKKSVKSKNLKNLLNLMWAQKINETAKHRIVGLTLETRPDAITPEEIKHLRELGCTRVELGVQTIDDKILKFIRRGHTAEDAAKATKLLRNAGFKVDYHLMPALPGVSPKKDLENFKKIFSDPRFRPDMIKIYPCSVIPKTPLYKLWKEGRYKPLATARLTDLIIKMKLAVPPYVRISRIIRDIPGDDIAAGNLTTSLRQNIQAEMERRGVRCKCIRCREVGHIKSSKSKAQSSNQVQILKSKLFIKKYNAGDGTEYFLSIESPKREALFAFCRLRLPKLSKKQKNNFTLFFTIVKNNVKNTFSGLEELEGAALVRELHTYGHLVPVDLKSKGAAQHTGFGRRLMKVAEKIAKQAGYKKLAVISGIGVREYYKKLGYSQKGTYMVKNI